MVVQSSPVKTNTNHDALPTIDTAGADHRGGWQSRFVKWLPRIRRYARRSFWYLRAEACDDAVEEVVAAAFVEYRRLVDQGRGEVAYASTLARYAVACQRAGRRVGGRLNVRDVLSPTCRRRKALCIQRLDRHCRYADWEAIIVEDRRAGPADVAATRIDFNDWLGTLTPRNRIVAEVLATGESTRCAARRFKVSPGRISQLRRELSDAWARFTSEPAAVK